MMLLLSILLGMGVTYVLQKKIGLQTAPSASKIVATLLIFIGATAIFQAALAFLAGPIVVILITILFIYAIHRLL